MKTKRLVMTALFTAILCIVGPLTIPIPVSPVPVTLVNLMIGLSVYILGTKRALISLVLYMLLGLAGLPVFSGMRGGAAVLAGPTGGYIIGYLFFAALTGLFIRLSERYNSGAVRAIQAAGLAFGTLLLYIAGTFWLSFNLGISFGEGLLIGVIPYLPGDIAKLVITLILGPMLAGRLKKYTMVE